MKLILVGDTHFDNRTPISRADDYAEVTIQKLDTLLKEAIQNKVETIVLSGDVFDKYQVSFQYLTALMRKLKDFQDNGIAMYSTIGNHDLPYNNKRYFEQTPLSLLFESGLIKHLVEEDLGEVKLYGIDFTEMERIEEIIKDMTILTPDKKTILSMHYATDNTIPNESIPREKLLNFNLVLSGHDHNFYPTDLENGDRIIRPGSFIRRTKEEYNLTRPIVYYIYDSETDKIEYKELPGVRPSGEVFKNEAINSAISSFDAGTFSQVFNEAYFKKEVYKFEDMIKDLPIDILDKTKKWLLDYFSKL